jgi:hypothetical protein
MAELQHRTLDEIESGFVYVLQSPGDSGVLELIVRRPRHDQREVLESAELSLPHGLIGDLWSVGKDASSSRAAQVTLTNSRLVHLLAGDKKNWSLAGDQLYVDFDLAEANLPPGTHLAIGTAVLEVSAKPHTGCRKYMARFGPDALQFISAPERKSLNLRGINCSVVKGGIIHVGDLVRKI